MSTVEKNKKGIVRYFIEVLQNQHVDLIPEMLDANYTFDGQPSDVAGNVAFVKSLHDQFPGMTYDIFWVVGDADMVAMRWQLNAPATATRGSGTIQGTNLVKCRDGKAFANVQISEGLVLDAPPKD